jgi:predicted dehydrogenase
MKSNRPPLVGALIGCGFVSRFHLEAWSGVEGAKLVAVCDCDPARLASALERVPQAAAYTDAAALFQKEPALEFVEICTGPESHRELVALAAHHGVEILCQKPAALDRDDFQAMIDACATANVRLMIHENWRFRPWYRALRAEIESGAIGLPILLRISHRDTRALLPDGFAVQPYLKTMPRLILMDMGCHLVDTARYLFGEIQSISATIGRFGSVNIGEDLAMLTVSFEGGAIGVLEMTWCASADKGRPEWALNETVLHGSAGSLKLCTDGSLEWTSPTGLRERRPVVLPRDDEVYVEGYAATQRHFIDGLLTGCEHETRAMDNLKTMDVVWAAYRSAEEGRTVRLE